MEEVLNPILYTRLVKAFGEVRVLNRGIEMDSVVVDGRKKKIHGGEEYMVCCPRCSDTRFRLQVNHLHGLLDPGTGASYAVTFGLVHCFNEDCNWGDFDIYVNTHGKFDKLLATKAEPSTLSLRDPVLPGNTVALSELPATHPALVYLEHERGFNVKELEHRWNVRYCTSSGRFPLVVNRLVIPIMFGGKFKGWQARFVGNPQSKAVPKYLTMPGFHKTLALFNFDETKDYDHIILCEGVFDVFRIGTPAICSFGHRLSFSQIKFLTASKAKYLFIAYDNDVKEATRKEVAASIVSIRAALEDRFSIFQVRLEPGKDPGDYSPCQFQILMTQAVQEA